MPPRRPLPFTAFPKDPYVQKEEGDEKKAEEKKEETKEEEEEQRAPKRTREYDERDCMYKIPVCLGNKTRQKGGRISIRVSLLCEKGRI